MDGGGIRGLLSVILLERLEARHPGMMDQVDLYAGTSTGGLLALGLAAGRTPTEARRLYEVYGRQVFQDSILDDVRDLGKLTGAEYSLNPLREVLTEQFGDMTLGDLKHKVLISAFDLDSGLTGSQPRAWKAKFFHNFPGPDSDAAFRVVDVAIYTAAAPTYFPTVDGYVDGGVVAGNPSVCALAQALHLSTGGQMLEDLVLLSIGTGHNPRFLTAQNADWGLAQWAPHMISLMMEGSSGLADYQCRQLLGESYLRLNPRLSVEMDMDDVSKIPELQQLASQFDLDDAYSWLNRHFN